MSLEHVDVRLVSKVAQFWRELLGEEEFQKHQPEDMFHWYHALETRGAMAVRVMIEERAHGRYRIMELRGIMPAAPHPPVLLVEHWLQKREVEARRFPKWWVTGLTVLSSLIVFPQLYMCANPARPPFMEYNQLPVVPGQNTMPDLTMTLSPQATPAYNAPLPPAAMGQTMVPATGGTQPGFPNPPTGQSQPGGSTVPGGSSVPPSTPSGGLTGGGP